MANRIRAPKDMTEVVDLIRRLPTYIRLVWALIRDSRVPAQQKLILVGIGAYLVFPIDLIPDFIPVIGYLDDLILVPLGILLVLRMLPDHVVAESRRKAELWMAEKKDKPQSYLAAAIILLLWIALAYWAWHWWSESKKP